MEAQVEAAVREAREELEERVRVVGDGRPQAERRAVAEDDVDGSAQSRCRIANRH